MLLGENYCSCSGLAAVPLSLQNDATCYSCREPASEWITVTNLKRVNEDDGLHVATAVALDGGSTTAE